MRAHRSAKNSSDPGMTDPSAPTPLEALTMTTGTVPMTFKSHIDGKNADVTIHQDRIEWALEAPRLAVFKKQRASEMIPISRVSSVATQKDGFRFTVVRVITSGNTIEFRVGHAEAQQIKTLLGNLMLAA